MFKLQKNTIKLLRKQKILVNSLNIEEAKLLKEKGDLNLKELENAVYNVYRKIQDEKILNYWASAIAIITFNLDSEIISDLSNDIKELVKTTKRYNLSS